MNTTLQIEFDDWNGLTYYDAALRLCAEEDTYANLAWYLENSTSDCPRIEAFLRVCELATLASAEYAPDDKPQPQGICCWRAIEGIYPDAHAHVQVWLHEGKPLPFSTEYLVPDFYELDGYTGEHEPGVYRENGRLVITKTRF